MKFLFTLLLLTCCTAFLKSQPFAGEIQEFKKQDSLKFPEERAILFVGSSSFRLWNNIQNYFPRRTVINRGFGGSTLEDVIYYADDIIFPYNPKQIIIYCGENDLASGKDVPSDTVVERFKRLFGIIRAKMPKVNVLYMAMKPSPSRRHLMNTELVANGEIRDFLEHQPHSYYLDVFHPMLVGNEPNAALFGPDSLHMNETGYQLWKKLLDPYLVRTK